MKLIYHKTTASRGGRSPIDAAILDVTRDAPVKIACPYLNRDYLERLVDHCGPRWKLVTDMAAWLSIVNPAERMRVLNFVKAHMGSVRDCRDLHAKVVIGKGEALIGSANLTKMGVCNRAEMCVQIDEGSSIAELEAWFDSLWSGSSEVDLKKFYPWAQSLPRRPSGAKPPSAGPVIDTVMIPLPTKPVLTDEEREELRAAYKARLLRRLARQAPKLADYDEKTPCNTVFPALDDRVHFEIRISLVANAPTMLNLAVVFHADTPEARKLIRKLDISEKHIIKALGLTDDPRARWHTGKLGKHRRVWVERDEDVGKRSKWSAQHQWLIDTLVKFHAVFTKQLKSMQL